MITWDTVGRHPHPFTRLHMLGMWMMGDKKAFDDEQCTLDKARRRQRKGDAPPTRLTRVMERVVESGVAGMKVWTGRPHRHTPIARAVHINAGVASAARRRVDVVLLQTPTA